MEFLTKAAAVVLSVLASLFTDVEAPQASAAHRPAPVQVASPVRPEVRIVVFPRPVAEPTRDPASELFLELISRGQTGSKPMAAEPWFRTPTVGETTDILQALLSGESL